MLVLGGLVAIALLCVVLYRTGWTSWRWDEARTALPEDGCSFVGREQVGQLVPDARPTGDLRKDADGQKLSCTAMSPAAAGHTSIQVYIYRQLPAPGAEPPEKGAKHFGELICESQDETAFRKELEELADPLCGSVTEDETEIKVGLVAVNGPDALEIHYSRISDGQATTEEARKAIAELAERLLLKLSSGGAQ